MKDMIKRMREEKGGFTLAELLIVVAIVLVLVAIAVPVFTGALDRANQARDNANIQSVKHAGATAILIDENYQIGANQIWTATADVAEDGTLTNLQVVEGQQGSEGVTDGSSGGWTVTAHITQTDLPDVG